VPFDSEAAATDQVSCGAKHTTVSRSVQSVINSKVRDPEAVVMATVLICKWGSLSLRGEREHTVRGSRPSVSFRRPKCTRSVLIYRVYNATVANGSTFFWGDL